MVRIFFVAILALLPLLVSAQSPINFAADIRPLFAKQSLNLHDDQFSSSFQKTRFEFSGFAQINRMVAVKYVVKPGFAYSERVEVTQTLLVGATDFGPKKDEKEAKQVNLDWSFGTGHRIELTTMRDLLNFPVQPVFIGEWSSLDLTATSSKKNSSEVTTDSERFNRFVCGFGGTFMYASPNIVATVTGAGSNQLQRFAATMLYRLSGHAAITGGYSSNTVDLGGVKWREHGPFVSILWAF